MDAENALICSVGTLGQRTASPFTSAACGEDGGDNLEKVTERTQNFAVISPPGCDEGLGGFLWRRQSLFRIIVCHVINLFMCTFRNK